MINKVFQRYSSKLTQCLQLLKNLFHLALELRIELEFQLRIELFN
jgi:hypothetical protein